MSKITPRDELKDEPALVGVYSDKIIQKPEVKEEPKTVTMTEEELRAMIKEVQTETREDTLADISPQLGVGEWQEKVEGKQQNKTARMRLYQTDSEAPLGVVIDFKFHKNVREETIDGIQVIQYYKMTVLYDDDKKEIVDITLKDFSLLHNFEIIEIIETEEKPLRRVLGKVLKTVKVDGYAMSAHASGGDVKTFAGSSWVDQEEVKLKTTHTIKRPNGKTFKIDNSRLNL